MLNILKHILLNCLSVCFIFRPSRELFTHAEMLPSQVKSSKFRPAAPRLRQSVWFLQLSKLTATRVIPFYCQSEDPWHSHHLSCVMEWDCHYPFHQLRSLNTGIKSTSLLHQGELHIPTTPPPYFGLSDTIQIALFWNYERKETTNMLKFRQTDKGFCTVWKK